MASSISRSILFAAQLCLAVLLSLCLSASVMADGETTAARPDRGTIPNGSYAVSGMDSISLQNGNLHLSIPLASLPSIAGGKLAWAINASYNSKIWNVIRTEADAEDSEYHPYVVDSPQLSELGGWRIGGQYQITIRNAHDDFNYLIPDEGDIPYTEYYLRMHYNWFKVVLTMPDGSEHELRPLDYAPYIAGDSFLHGYYKEIPSLNGTMRYHSLDGSYLYAVITSDQNWTVFMRDGTKIIQTTDGIQRIQDTNGNKIKIFTDANGTHYQDELTGREIRYVYNQAGNSGQGQGQVWYQTVGGTWVHVDINFGYTTVEGKIYRVKDWIPFAFDTCSRFQWMPPQDIQVVREIILPKTETEVTRKFTFSYNSDTTETATSPSVNFICNQPPESYTRTASKGWGELSKVVTPTNAVIEYSFYSATVHHALFDLDKLAEAHVVEKKQTHDGTSERWEYELDDNIGLVRNPDQSLMAEYRYSHSPGFGHSFGKAGLVFRSIRPFTRIDRHWTEMQFSGVHIGSPGGPVFVNPVVDFEYTTLLDANGNMLKMSAKAFQYDYNGNVTQTTEYDWFDPALVARDSNGVPTGVPASATVLRVTNNSYYNAATSASSGNVYAKRSLSTGAPLILSAIKDSSTGASQVRFSYDGQAYGTAPSIGNLTTLSKWHDAASSWINTSMTYDAYGNVATATDARGKVTQFFHEDATHALPTRVVVDPQNGTGQQTSHTSYDFSTGAVLSQTDANNQVSTLDYINHMLGTVDPFGRPGIATSPAVTINGTPQHRRIKTIYKDGERKVIVSSDLNAENDGLLKSETLSDEMGRVIETRQYETSTAYITTKQTYDAMGRVSQVSNPYRSGDTVVWTTTTYDTLGRVLTVTTPDNAVATTSYYANEVTATDQAGKARRSVTDALGRLIEVIEDPAGLAYLTSYKYDALGNLRKVQQGTQPARYFMYDSLSRLIRAKNPEQDAYAALALTDPVTGNGDWSLGYTYDDNGNLITRWDARGRTTTYTYDALNRATFRDYSDSTPDVTSTYDTLLNGKGRLTSVSSSVSASNYAGYDALGKLTGSAQVTDGQTYQMTYEYNLAGALTRQTYPSGRVVTTTYDDAGRFSQLNGQKTGEANKTYLSSPSYTAHGAIKDIKLGNNLWEHISFNERLQPTEIGLGTQQAGVDRLKLNYSYGTTSNNGNVQTQTITIPNGPTLSQSYQYDQLNRLQMAQENGGTNWKQTFVYDRYGNRTFDAANTTANALSSLLTIDATNNRLAAGQGAILYDQAGNLITDFNGHTFGYDAENRQTTSDGGAAANGTDYRYDGDGRRVKKVHGTGQATTIFVYNAAGQLVAEYETASQQGTGGTNYLTTDNLGTPRIITDANGTVMATHDYLPFGEEIGLVGGRTAQHGYVADDVNQKFSGKERDAETGLDYFGARYYASAQGRFTSPDNFRNDTHINIPASWNLYTYVRNNPLSNVDDNGRWLTSVHEKIIDRAFSGWTKQQRQILKNASRWLDSKEGGAYNPNNQYQHALRNKGQSPEEAAKLAAMFIGIAKDEADREPNFNEKLRLFGLALHTVQDNTSPSHEGFREWHTPSGNVLQKAQAYGDWVAHAFGETAASYDYYRVGVSLGAADVLTQFFFGGDEANRARGGAARGSVNDPVINEINNMWVIGNSESAKQELLYMYRRGLAEGENRTRRLLNGRP